MQHPQNNLLLLLYKGCTPLSAFAKQFTVDASLWAHPCCAGALVCRQLCYSEHAAAGGSLPPSAAGRHFWPSPAPLGDGPHVVKSEFGSKHNFLQHSQEILSQVWACSFQIKDQLQNFYSNPNCLQVLGSGVAALVQLHFQLIQKTLSVENVRPDICPIEASRVLLDTLKKGHLGHIGMININQNIQIFFSYRPNICLQISHPRSQNSPFCNLILLHYMHKHVYLILAQETCPKDSPCLV